MSTRRPPHGTDVLVGIDFGTTKICVVVGKPTPDGIEIVGIGKQASHGIRKGVVVNIPQTVEAVKKAVEVAELMAGCKITTAYAGIAGALFAPLVNFIEPAPFGIANSLLFLMMVVVGGSGRFYGPVLGAAIALLLPEYLRFLKDWYLAVFGFAAVIMMIWLPGGLLSLREALLLRKAKREAKQKELSERAAAAAGKGTVEAA